MKSPDLIFSEAIGSNRVQGFTLIEVMVTLLILSVGLLGLAGMIGQSLRFNQGGYTRSQGTFLAYEIIDLMRADANNADDYAVIYDSNIHVCIDNPDAGDNLVNATLGCWYNRVARELPGGTATIVNDPNVATDSNVLEYEITMTWIDRSNNNQVVNQTWMVEIS
ncbi:MAG: type IV pilus modification protein PilV [Immundisolibacteraceae bacterium]|nr:type IV pilus modification protein PilV [Immundisolibacteraceae bacterium]